MILILVVFRSFRRVMNVLSCGKRLGSWATQGCLCWPRRRNSYVHWPAARVPTSLDTFPDDQEQTQTMLYCSHGFLHSFRAVSSSGALTGPQRKITQNCSGSFARKITRNTYMLHEPTDGSSFSICPLGSLRWTRKAGTP